jgi:hypothetical protein
MATPKQSKSSPAGKAFRIDGREQLSAAEEHRLRGELRAARRALDEALSARVRDDVFDSFVRKCLLNKTPPPAWTLAPKQRKRHEVIPVVNVSDWHFDEKVSLDQVQGRNCYDRATALARWKLFVERTIKVARGYNTQFSYPGIVTNWLGDMFSGFIHEELEQTNEDTLVGSLLYWLKPCAWAVKTLADEFGQVWFTGVVGNHPRMSRKPRAKFRARDNFDYLLYHLIRHTQADDQRIHWLISESQKLQFSIYDHRFIASHGDECRGGSGIAGMLSPQLIAMARMKKMFEFDTWLLGHWHYRADYRGIRVNGSGKGFDEYAAIGNFDFQKPVQDFFLVAPQHGIISSWPVFCWGDDEPWVQERQVNGQFNAR